MVLFSGKTWYRTFIGVRCSLICRDMISNIKRWSFCWTKLLIAVRMIPIGWIPYELIADIFPMSKGSKMITFWLTTSSASWFIWTRFWEGLIYYHGYRIRVGCREVEQPLFFFLMDNGIKFANVGKRIHGKNLTAEGSVWFIQSHKELKDTFNFLHLVEFLQGSTRAF